MGKTDSQSLLLGGMRYGKGLMGHPHPVGVDRGPFIIGYIVYKLCLYPHNGNCFQKPSCLSYRCFVNKINLTTDALDS